MAALKEWTGAPVYAHPAEQRHIDGTYPYEGITRWCGRLEALGRKAYHYRSALIDEPLGEGDELPMWGGLRVIHPAGPYRGPLRFLQRPARSPLLG